MFVFISIFYTSFQTNLISNCPHTKKTATCLLNFILKPIKNFTGKQNYAPIEINFEPYFLIVAFV